MTVAFNESGVVGVFAAVLIASTIISLARFGARRLRAVAISVYGGPDRLPHMRWARGCFLGWFVPCAAWVVSNPGSGIWWVCAWLFYLSCLGLLALIDARTGLLPNELTLVLLLAGLCWQAAAADFGLPGATYCWGAVLGWLVPAALNACHERWRGSTAIGPGDAKLLSGIGAWLGASALPWVWVLASLALVVYTACQALYVRRWQSQVAFGPFLAVGGSAALLRTML